MTLYLARSFIKNKKKKRMSLEYFISGARCFFKESLPSL